MKPIAILAVAALAATAISFDSQGPAFAYCRGCAVGAASGVVAGAVAVDAIEQNRQLNAATAPSLPPGTPPADLSAHSAYDSAVCHNERTPVTDGSGNRRWTNTEVCN